MKSSPLLVQYSKLWEPLLEEQHPKVTGLRALGSGEQVPGDPKLEEREVEKKGWRDRETEEKAKVPSGERQVAEQSA